MDAQALSRKTVVPHQIIGAPDRPAESGDHRESATEWCREMECGLGDPEDGRVGDLDSYLQADKVFHRTLLDASGNEMFRALNAVVAEVLTGRTHHGMMPAAPNPEAIALHDEVARAIRLRDEVGAERAMRAIIDEARAAVADDHAAGD